ncbi:hypothetical protein AAE478_000042 [Parahypoxylon ruwenzoriense]
MQTRQLRQAALAADIVENGGRSVADLVPAEPFVMTSLDRKRLRIVARAFRVWRYYGARLPVVPRVVRWAIDESERWEGAPGDYPPPILDDLVDGFDQDEDDDEEEESALEEGPESDSNSSGIAPAQEDTGEGGRDTENNDKRYGSDRAEDR